MIRARCKHQLNGGPFVRIRISCRRRHLARQPRRGAEDAEERFDIDLGLRTVELSLLLADPAQALGGEKAKGQQALMAASPMGASPAPALD